MIMSTVNDLAVRILHRESKSTYFRHRERKKTYNRQL